MMTLQKNLILGEKVAEAIRFLAESEEKIIAGFMDIAGLGDKYREVVAGERGEFRDYEIALLMEELSRRGYEIYEYHETFASKTGINGDIIYRIVLFHNSEKIAYSGIEIKTDSLWRKQWK